MSNFNSSSPHAEPFQQSDKILWERGVKFHVFPGNWMVKS